MSTDRYLSEFELHVLLAIQGLGGDAYGGSIRREIEARSRRRVWAGPLYTTLARLEELGLVTSRQGEPLPVRGGRSRRYYRQTANGVRALRQALAMLDRMRHAAGLAPSARVSK
jgi:DNA-binding PadR family transcriptional regulator